MVTNPGSVVQRTISVNPGLNFNLAFFFICSKGFSRIIFSILVRFTLSYLNSNFTLTLDYLNLTLNNPALAPVVQKVDNAIHRINHYPLDSAIGFPNTYPLDSDLSGG